jgi:hypothetical protein
LAALELHHPEPQRVAAFLESLHLADDVPVSVHATSGDPFLVARIRTPNGLRTLGAPKPIIRADTP